MRQHIAAYTDAEPNVPAYVSINKEETGQNKYVISVRSRGDQTFASIAVCAEVLESLARDVLVFLDREQLK